MKYVLVVGHMNGRVQYFGPFDTHAGALAQGACLPIHLKLRWHVGTVEPASHVPAASPTRSMVMP